MLFAKATRNVVLQLRAQNVEKKPKMGTGLSFLRQRPRPLLNKLSESPPCMRDSFGMSHGS